ncbi:HAD family hydrolase [Candidatus Kaiserbacteria bacterium]|nr:HAD family hydrolase [Candidatus Kaiserbacteria bacterium]
MKLSAVFLDRDGVINEDVGFASRRKEAPLLSGVASAIRLLNEQDIPVFVVSNQAGIARGHHTEDDAHHFNESLAAQLKDEGAHIEDWYFCPHHPEGSIEEYAIDCDCRKPKTGLLERAAKEHGVELSRSVMIGDKMIDIEAGRAVGARTILVLTGQGKREWTAWKADFKPAYVAKDLTGAMAWLLA